MTEAKNLWAIVMAGGSGTRFWPESREQKPKQFLNFGGTETLFEETLTRVAPVIPKSRVIVVTQKKYAAQVSKLGKLPASQVIGEPAGRNTAPCVALAAAMILKKDPHAVLAILPSDHKIGKPRIFQALLKEAGKIAASSGMPVTFGIKPSCPHTGYGYLEIGNRWSVIASGAKQSGFKNQIASSSRQGGTPRNDGTSFKVASIYHLKSFREKPNFKKAESYVRSGKFLWNSGMFVWRADAVMAAARQFLPEVYAKVLKIAGGPSFTKSLNKIYPAMPHISIDYGLMEKLKGKILTIPADIDWCDLGGWPAFKDLCPSDVHGNVHFGKVIAAQSRGNLVKSSGRLIALVGVENLVVVDTGDTVLITTREKSEQVRDLVMELRKRGWKQYL